MHGAVILLTALATPAAAQTVTITPLAEARLRYEGDDQDGLARRADAVTLQARTGVQAATPLASTKLSARPRACATPTTTPIA